MGSQTAPLYFQLFTVLKVPKVQLLAHGIPGKFTLGRIRKRPISGLATLENGLLQVRETTGELPGQRWPALHFRALGRLAGSPAAKRSTLGAGIQPRLKLMRSGTWPRLGLNRTRQRCAQGLHGIERQAGSQRPSLPRSRRRGNAERPRSVRRRTSPPRNSP